MRLIKISFLFAVLAVFSSCLKSKNDIAGLMNDKGGIVTSIAETEYIDQDNNTIGFPYYGTTSFDFGSLPGELVKFLSVHVSQPRDAKVNGSLKLGFTASNGSGTPLPAGALNISPITIPAFDGASKDFNIKFAVTKTALDPNEDYSVVLTLATVDQGIISANANSIEIFIHNSKFYGRYKCETTVTDPLNYIKITKNTRSVMLDDLVTFFGPPAFFPPNYLSFDDEYSSALLGGTQGLSILVDNLVTGTTATRYALMYPTYALNTGTGNVTGVFNTLTGANYNVTFTADLANKFTYTANDDRTLEVSYTVTLTAPIPGGTSSRVFKVLDKYTYHPIQVRIF
jgi:hypothetical protein